MEKRLQNIENAILLLTRILAMNEARESTDKGAPIQQFNNHVEMMCNEIIQILNKN